MTNALVRICALAILVAVVVAMPAHADNLADAKAFIGKQVELIKAGDVAGLKAGLTERLRDRVTEDHVKSAQREVAKYTIDDLVASVAPSADGLKIMMKNGRSLTTLVKVDGKWAAADTLWFK